MAGFFLTFTILDSVGERSWKTQKIALFWGFKTFPPPKSKIVKVKKNPAIKSCYTYISTDLQNFKKFCNAVFEI